MYKRIYTAPPDWTMPKASRLPQLLKALREIHADRVHLFREYMVAFAEPFLPQMPCQLDLDECESRTRRRIAALARQNGHTRMAEVLEEEARFYERSERQWLQRFERIFVASESDRVYLLEQNPRLRIHVLANTIHLPGDGSPRRQQQARGDSPFTILFVGNLSYYPNEDGVRYFVQQILPLIRLYIKNVCFEIAGAGASGSLKRFLWRAAAVRFLGYQRDLAPAYARADVAVIPLRAGGGTRIKILEAFAHRVPVISTTTGAEGICATNEEHLLLADTPQQFAEACVRMANSDTLQNELSVRAYSLVAQRYSTASLQILD
jgi:glycosyltransferase involved in cell wall biosynthesis